MSYKNSQISLIDLILTNKTSLFQTTLVTEIALSDYHNLVPTFFKSHLFHFRSKTTCCRNYKAFNVSKFLYYVQKRPLEVLHKIGVLKNFAKLTGKHPCQKLFFNKVAGLWSVT